jgi:predicted GNAT superfamily acetyltransferase
MEALPVIRRLNRTIFNEARIINQFDRPDLLMLVASSDGEPVGFKVGYGESRTTFYSAKGGVLELWRRRGVARAMLLVMMDEVRAMGYTRFAYDTFPNLHPGMTILGLREGFRVTAAGFNSTYQDYRLRLEQKL